MWHLGWLATASVCEVESSGENWIRWPGEIPSSSELDVHTNYRVGALEGSWVLIRGNPLLIAEEWEGRVLAWGHTGADPDERTGLLFPNPVLHPWFRWGKTALWEVTPQPGGRERLGRRPSVLAATRLPGAVTLRSGQFTFGCFQSIKAPCLEMRVLADLTPSVEFKGLCNSLVWNRVWAWLRKTLEPISARSSCSA